MNDLVKFESESGQLVQFGANDVKQRLCPNIEDKELALVMALCQQQRLNPFTKDVYIIKYGSSPASIVTSKEVFTKRANANKKYQGFEAGITFIDRQGNVRQREGSAVYKAANETLVGGWCRVFVEGRKPFYDEVTLEEYSTGKSGWAKMPATMIRKVALVHCLREAFPDDFQGLYSQEEMDAKIAEDKARAARKANQQHGAPSAAAAEPLQADFVEMISDAQDGELQAKCHQFAEMRGQDANAVYDALINSATLKAAGVKPGEMFTFDQAALAIKLLDSWIEKAQAAQIAQGFEDAQQTEAQGYESALDARLDAARAASIGDGTELASEDIAF